MKQGNDELVVVVITSSSGAELVVVVNLKHAVEYEHSGLARTRILQHQPQRVVLNALVNSVFNVLQLLRGAPSFVAVFGTHKTEEGLVVMAGSRRLWKARDNRRESCSS